MKLNSLSRLVDSSSSMTDISEEGDSSCSGKDNNNNNNNYYYYSRIETKSFEFFCQIAYDKDWANDKKRDYLLSQITNFTFPQKLYLLLTYNHTDSVMWCDDGRSFRILDKDRFMSDVVPRFYNQKDFRSFIRQLNVYGFLRVRYEDKTILEYTQKQFQRENLRSIYSIPRREPQIHRGVDRRTKMKNELIAASMSTSSTTTISPTKQSSSKPTLKTFHEAKASENLTSLVSTQKSLVNPSDFEFDPFTVFESTEMIYLQQYLPEQLLLLRDSSTASSSDSSIVYTSNIPFPLPERMEGTATTHNENATLEDAFAILFGESNSITFNQELPE